MEWEFEGGFCFVLCFQKGGFVCLLNADGKTWVERKRVNVKREVTTDNKVPDQVGDEVPDTGEGIAFRQKGRLLS